MWQYRAKSIFSFFKTKKKKRKKVPMANKLEGGGEVKPPLINLASDNIRLVILYFQSFLYMQAMLLLLCRMPYRGQTNSFINTSDIPPHPEKNSHTPM